MSADLNPADKIRIAKEAAEMGRKLRKGKPMGFHVPRMYPRDCAPKPSCKEALSLAIEVLRYNGPSPIADWCELGLPRAAPRAKHAPKDSEDAT